MWVGQDAGPIYNMSGPIYQPTAKLDFEVLIRSMLQLSKARDRCQACACAPTVTMAVCMLLCSRNVQSSLPASSCLGAEKQYAHHRRPTARLAQGGAEPQRFIPYGALYANALQNDGRVAGRKDRQFTVILHVHMLHMPGVTASCQWTC